MKKRIVAVFLTVMMTISASLNIVCAEESDAEQINHVADGTVPVSIGSVTFDFPNWPMLPTGDNSTVFFPSGSKEDIYFLFMVSEVSESERAPFGESWDEPLGRFAAEGALKEITKQNDVVSTDWYLLENGNGVAMSMDWRTDPRYTCFATFVGDYMVMVSAVDPDLSIDDFSSDIDSILSSAKIE